MTDTEQPQLVLLEPGRAAWRAAPTPALDGGRPAEALVRPIAVATCDLDTAVNAGAYPLPLPYALGHEFVAEVVEVGAGVTRVAPGDVVAVPFQINCGTCGYCRRGRTGDCDSVPHVSGYGLGRLGGERWGAAMTDLVRVPFADAMLVPVPAGVDPATVVSLDNLTDGHRTVAPYLPLLDGDPRVLVLGGMSVGLYAVAVARALGVEVTYLDRDERRLGIAERLGAAVGDVDDDPGLFRLTVHTSSRERTLRTAIRATDRGGTLVDTGIFPGDVPLPMLRMYTVGITLVTGRVHARHHIPDVLALVADGRLDPSVVTATTVGWDEAAEAWSAHTGKLVVVR